MMLDEEFIKKVRMAPEFERFIDAANKKLNIENGYVRHFAPKKHQVFEEDGRYVMGLMKKVEREEEAIDNLLDDHDGWFADFVHEEIGDEVVELCRALIKLERGL